MSAPTKPAAEQATQPLPVSPTLPPGNGLSSERGVWAVPATAYAAIGVGLLLREYAPHLRYEIAIGGVTVVLLGCLVVAVLGILRGGRP